MEDGRKNNGGNKGCGRKSKAEEQNLIEKLSPLVPNAFKALEEAINDKKDWAIKLFFEYTYGKPKQMIEQKNINVDAGKLTDEEIQKINEKLESSY